jgi:drug/metabolite transporter (DMT)-like permease
MGLALLAAFGIGGFLWFVARASEGGHTLPALLGTRLGSLTLLSIGVLVTRSSIRIPRSQVPIVASIGLLDTAANGLFAVATQHGYVAVVSVLGSEYPVVTVILAHAFLGERITPPQWLGVALALTGVGMVAAA